MPEHQAYHIHPLGWENDPEEERFKVTTLDYLSVQAYNNYALFFRLADEDKRNAAEVLKAGLERTLSQVRHLCGTIEKDTAGGHAFCKKRDSTVQFIVQWPESEKYPSLDEIEQSHFSAVKLGDLNIWSVPPMTYGEKPEANPDHSPVVAAYKANFVRGGLVFIMHHHHYSNDVMGWAGLTHQLAENCYAIVNKTPFPDWDPKNLDRSRVTKREPPEEAKVDGPPAPERHPEQRTGISLLFHLPKSKAAQLKLWPRQKMVYGSQPTTPSRRLSSGILRGSAHRSLNPTWTAALLGRGGRHAETIPKSKSAAAPAGEYHVGSTKYDRASHGTDRRTGYIRLAFLETRYVHSRPDQQRHTRESGCDARYGRHGAG
jgi:hypothetical protein